MTPPAAELVLGGAQLGLAYGIANKAGRPHPDRVRQILACALDCGVRQVDTARGYGESEANIGAALADLGPRAVDQLHIVTKLDPLADLASEVDDAEVEARVDASVLASLQALRRDHLSTLLVHRAAQLSWRQGLVWRRLRWWRDRGAIQTLGASVQSPDELLATVADPDVAHVQMPYNLLDHRWVGSVYEALDRRPEVVLHARSSLLQGLLVLDPTRWPVIEGVTPADVVARIDDAANRLGRRSRLDLCFAYVRGWSRLDGVVVGTDSAEQLIETAQLFETPPLTAAERQGVADAPVLPTALIDPAQWPR